MNSKQIGLRVQQGFTLIELVIVLVLLGILVAVAVPKYTDLTVDARDSAAAAAAGAVNSAFSIATGVNKGAPTPAQVTAQMVGASINGDNFEVTMPDGTVVSVPATYYTDQTCATPTSTASTYVCSISVGSETYVAP